MMKLFSCILMLGPRLTQRVAEELDSTKTLDDELQPKEV